MQNTSNSTHGTKVFNKCQVGTEKHTAYIAHPLKPKESTEKLVEIPIFYFKNKTKYTLGIELLHFFFHPCFPTSNVLSNTIIRQCTESKQMTSKAVCYLLLVLSQTTEHYLGRIILTAKKEVQSPYPKPKELIYTEKVLSKPAQM